jgi:glucose-1-phosphate adenylyltransferase
VDKKAAPSLGILKADAERRITEFVEKPKDPAVLASMESGSAMPKGRPYLASMGIYIFNRETLRDCLDGNDGKDFGKNILPAAIGSKKVSAFIHDGYWEDIGTIGAFYLANLDLLAREPKFDFGLSTAPIYTRARFLPGSVVEDCQVIQAIVSDGCIIRKSILDQAVIGIRSRIGSGCQIRRSILMGADYYETPIQLEDNRKRQRPAIGLGEGTVIEDAIIDKNVRIGRNVVIRAAGKDRDMDGQNFYVRDGVVIIPKGSTISDGTVI